MKLTMANRVSLLRIAIVPLFFLFFVVKSERGILAYSHSIAAFLFIVAAITDLVDGYLARKYGDVTNFGKLVDPIADKLLVLTALICLVEAGKVGGWVAIVIIGRDMIITGIRSLAAAHGEIIAALPSGKWKTTAQLTAIITCLVFMAFVQIINVGKKAGAGWVSLAAVKFFLDWHMLVVDILMYIAVFMAIYSGAVYIYKYRSLMRD